MAELIVAMLFVLILAAGAVALLAQRRRDQARIAGMSPAERALHDAEQAYARDVKSAESLLKVAAKEYDKQVKVAERGLRAAESFGQQKLGSYGALTAWEHQLKTDRGTFPLDGAVVASVDTAGNLATDRRSTLTRMAAGGIVAGPVGMLAGGMLKKNVSKDVRELYLMVEGRDFATLVECKPDHAGQVRQLAISINMAAKTAATRAKQRADGIRAAQEQLARARANTAHRDAAQEALNATRNETGIVDAARQALESETRATTLDQ